MSTAQRPCEASNCASPAALVIEGVAVCERHAKEVAEYARATQMIDTLDAESIREFLGTARGPDAKPFLN